MEIERNDAADWSRELAWVGAGLKRPECVLATAAGEIFTSDRRGGVMRIGPDGGQTLLGGAPITPNGVAMLRDRSFLMSNLAGDGGIWRVTPDGQVAPWLTEIDGVALPGVNFVWLDQRERVWICVSTPRKGDATYNKDIADGFIALKDGRGVRIVADGLCFTNECRTDPSGRFLYVHETFGRRLTRFDLAESGALVNRTTVADYGPETWPDGMAIDIEGAIWAVSVISNKLIRTTPDGRQTLILSDPDPSTNSLEALHRSNRMTRPMLSATKGTWLSNISSVCFGGADLRTLYLGCLNGDRLARFRVPVAGLKPVHWHW